MFKIKYWRITINKRYFKYNNKYKTIKYIFIKIDLSNNIPFSQFSLIFSTLQNNLSLETITINNLNSETNFINLILQCEERGALNNLSKIDLSRCECNDDQIGLFFSNLYKFNSLNSLVFNYIIIISQ